MQKEYLVHHLLESAVSASAQKEFLVDLVGERRSFEYQNFLSMVRNCAAVLQQHGLAARHRVAVLLPKCAEEAAAILAATMAGGTFVNINPLLLGHQVAHILTDCAASFLITSKHEWAKIACDATKVTSLRALLLIDDEVVEDNLPFSCCAGVMDGNDEPRPSSAIGEDLAGIVYTSGSTGKPRGVMVSHRNLLAGARIVSSYVGISSSDRILSILPFSFDYGLNQLLTAARNAASIVLLQYRFASEIVHAIQNERITGLAGVPLMWAGLVHHTSGLSDITLPSLRYITNSGGAVPPAIVRRLRRLLPATRVFLMYGLTEAFRSTYLPPEELDRRPDSIGKAIPETEILIINTTGQPCKPLEIGVLVHRGPTVSLGYWRKPELTAQSFRPHPFIPADQGGETVCYSGDLVKMDEEGFLYFVSRADEQIKTHGYRVSPGEIEEILMQGSDLAQAAVIGLPAADSSGEKIHAIVVPANGPLLDVEAIFRRCAQRLPPYMVPKSIEVVERLPITPNGKIDYKSLRSARAEQIQ
jgi:acyl-CoA ligase (AMP-forming) (exosortase A-associated)